MLANSSTRNWLLADELSVPVTDKVPAPTTRRAVFNTGVFCKSLAPVSASPASFSVTPSLFKSMPMEPLLVMRLPKMALPPLLALAMFTPRPLLLAMKLPAPAAVPPIRLAFAPLRTTTPSPLPKANVPVALLPMVLPATVLLSVPKPNSSTPAKLLPPMTLPAPAALPPTVLPELPLPIQMP